MKESGIESECMTEKRNDSYSATEFDAVEARLASLLDFSYEPDLCLLLHFAFIWHFTPHPWHMIWLHLSSPFLTSPFLSLPFSLFKCCHRPVFTINNAPAGARPGALWRRASKDRSWVTILATLAAFLVSSSVGAKVLHSSVFGRLDMM